MEHAITHFTRMAPSGPRLAQVVRKPLRRPRTRKMKRPSSLGAHVPMPQAFRKRRAHRTAASATADLTATGAREQEWLRSHWREYAGKWIALCGNRLLAEAGGAREALEKARAAGVKFPFLVHVTGPSELPFGGW
jgi:hypothetical protein